MSNASVLAAAAALRCFTAAQLAAYCAEDAAALDRVLAAHQPLVERLPEGGWRVVDTAALRELIGTLVGQREQDARRDPTPGRPREAGTRAAERLLMAEQLLLDCAGEPDRGARQVMAATAQNHLRQCAAAFSPTSSAPWWELDQNQLANAAFRVDTDLITTARLRLDLALARFTGSEATGGTVAMDELVRAAGEVDELPAEMAGSRRLALVRRFVSLSSRVLRLPSGTLDQSAPARFLATVARRRVADKAVESPLPPPGSANGHGPAAHLIRLLNGLAHEPLVRRSEEVVASRLIRIVDRLPTGRTRIAVYADLVPLLPADCHWNRHDDSLPGAVVLGEADERAELHLVDCARVLEGELRRSPFNSDSALIGQAAYALENLAVERADRGDTVLNLAEENRRTLLKVAGVPI